MKLNTYQKVAIATVIATLFLIFVGGLVRATGSGLGCPDWPQCFGSWIPPLSVEDLPPEFDPEQFNVWKTWTEYVNRLVGVAIGLLIIATFVFSFRYRSEKPIITWSSGIALVLVLFQGWLGGQVVESELSEWLISAHMLLAMLIVNLLLFAAYKAIEERLTLRIDAKARRSYSIAGMLLFVFSLLQMLVGTQVREAVDRIGKATPDLPREFWLPSMGFLFEFHRSFSWLIVALGLFLVWRAFKSKSSPVVKNTAYAIALVILAQFLVGIGLSWFDIPPALQTIHLLLSAVLMCAEFLFLLFVYQNRAAATAPGAAGNLASVR